LLLPLQTKIRGAPCRYPPIVGIIANPASGRDLRRLTANAGLYSSTDKASAIQRLLAAFGATGIGQVLLPSDMTGIAAAVLKASQGPRPASSTGRPSRSSTCH
jgi:predicted polyphosphate/ATP-dependent NAD kinase